MKMQIFFVILSTLGALACSVNLSGVTDNSGNNALGPGKTKLGDNKPGNESGDNQQSESDSSSSTPMMCVLTERGMCVQFRGSDWNVGEVQRVCLYYQGVMSSGVCAAASVIGECVLNKGLNNEAIIKYYPPQTRENAFSDCQDANGVFH